MTAPENWTQIESLSNRFWSALSLIHSLDDLEPRKIPAEATY